MAEFVNIAAHLPIMAEQQPDALAVAVQGARDASGKHAYERVTARELDEESNRLARGLHAIGITRGARTVLMVSPSVEFFTLTFALFKAGAVPVMVDPGMGIKNLKACLAEAEPSAFVGISKAHVARVILGWARGTNRINVTVGRKLFWGGHTLERMRSEDAAPIMTETGADEAAAVLFTSGSTGIPKGAVYTHANFEAQVASLRADYGVEPGERDLATFPLFALFGPALGMAAVVPMMDASRPITADPTDIIAAIEDLEATNLFASPALIELVGQYGAGHGVSLPSLKRVISAGAPAEPASLARFAGLLADGIDVTPSYGATEALPVAKIGSTELLEETASLTDSGAGVCVGRAVSGIELRVVRITDEPISEWTADLELPAGEIGEICVKGPVVTREYFRRDASTELAKISEADGAGFWHRMGDLGYADESGRVWFCGRKSQRVITDRGTLFTIPCERIFNTLATVRRTALVGVARGGTTVPVLCVELEAPTGKLEQEALRLELRAVAGRHEQTASIETFLFHAKFPVDVRHNAKIFREQLAVWAKEQLG